MSILSCKLNLFHVVVTLLLNQTLICSACLKNPLKDPVRDFSNAAVKSADILSQSMLLVSNQLSNSINNGVTAASEAVQELAKPVAELAKNVNLQIDSGDLANIGKAATENLRMSIEALARNWNLAIDTADLKDFGAEVARHLSAAIQNINVRVELLIGINEHLLDAITHTTDVLTKSFDNGINATADTVRQLAGTVTDLAKQVSVRVDSNDLAKAGSEIAEKLRDALAELSRNWEIAINTADLRGVGGEAAEQLSKAIQNINVHFHFEVGTNVVQIFFYMSISLGVVFSVLCVAMVISIKRCRGCMHGLCLICVEGCKNCRSGKDRENDNKSCADNATPTTPNNNSQEMQSFLTKRNNLEETPTSAKRIHSPVDYDDDYRHLYETPDNSRELNRILSFEGYKHYEPVKNFWTKMESQNINKFIK